MKTPAFHAVRRTRGLRRHEQPYQVVCGYTCVLKPLAIKYSGPPPGTVPR